ncbi:flagellar basal body protein [Wenxinia saemankumensis]|uniref:Flagellar basal-body rod protein FlgB n=1 Tax=Wenxinia saemankumensis TaxID=1447782 RepID=A0A1M6G5S6_9RHOB|nr:flagellar basal body protein [Wenxinia saemankumensis]SHJ05312.1 flagellar basal-body rod protein FlgB [Wenxinia saemankumensis]
MYENLTLMRTATEVARHAGLRQDVVATNLANADTPGFRAMTLGSFADVVGDRPLATSRPGHLRGASEAGTLGMGRTSARAVDAGLEPAPNGNSVSVELEMVAAADVEREHNRALAIYRHAMTVLRAVTSGR